MIYTSFFCSLSPNKTKTCLKSVDICRGCCITESVRLMWPAVLTDRQRPADGEEEKSTAMSVIIERINVALAANDELVTSLTMASSYN